MATKLSPAAHRPRVIVALCAVAAAAGCIAASLLTWLSVSDAGGTTTVSGWGTVSGGQIDGQNINDLLEGFATFRPGTLALIIGSLALLAAVSMAVFARGSRPARIPASVLALCGVTGLAWGVWKGVAPNSVDLPDFSSGASGAGPWLTAACSAILLTVALLVFSGLLDPPPPLPRKGIQPR